MPEIDIVLGNKEKKDIVKYVEEFLDEKIVDVADISKQKEFDEYGCITYSEKSRTTIKIQDGCNNFCSYCLIPYARGRIRSRNKENILQEAREIAKSGIKEIVLTGIHIASYSKDFARKSEIPNSNSTDKAVNVENVEEYLLINLLEDLNKIEGIERIRLGSLEPTIITEDFCKRLSKLEKVCNHFHLSLQSGCNETLKRMNRKYTVEQFKKVTELLRKYFKDVNLTTDIIVGFPGETEQEFKQTYKFLEDICFYKMHIFKYSKREGTVAAKMSNQIDGSIQEERSRKLITMSDKNQKMYNEKYVGRDIEVLFEEKQGEYWVGHTMNYMVVKFKSDENLENKIKRVTIEEGSIE